MRVIRLSDGSSWIARVHEPRAEPPDVARIGWDAILFERDPATVAQRLVYRPAGWLTQASPADLIAALQEGVVVRTRWGA